MKLYIVRHGETIQNRSNIIQGQQHGELSPLGLLQRDRLAERLQTLSFDAVYSSDLRRTRDTLAPYAETANVPVQYTHHIRERSFGDFEGAEGRVYVEKLKELGLSRMEYRPPNGENFHDLQARTDAFLNEMREKHFQQSVLLMTHGGVIRTMLASLLNLSVEDLLRDNIRNASLNIVSFSENWEVQEQVINDFSHLEGLEEPGEHSSGIDVMKGGA